MKIISWDIGIKNLAYCILEESNDPLIPFKIYHWDLINLTEINQKCFGFISNNNKIECCNKITNKLNILDKTINFCDLHKHQTDKIKTEYLNKIKNLENDSFCNNIIKNKGELCNKKAVAECNGKLYCTTHINQVKKKIEQCKLEKFKTNANKIPIEDIKLNMIKKLDSLNHLLDVDYVIIENQPALKNPKMKAISDTLYTWFLIRGIVDKKNNNKIKKIIYC